VLTLIASVEHDLSSFTMAEGSGERSPAVHLLFTLNDPRFTGKVFHALPDTDLCYGEGCVDAGSLQLIAAYCKQHLTRVLDLASRTIHCPSSPDYHRVMAGLIALD
jgi:hypothetical protein